MLIRKGHVEDSEAICALFEQVDAFHAAGRPDMFRPPSSALQTPAFIQALLANPANTLFVAERDAPSLD